MSQTDQAIAPLRSSIDVLHALATGIQMQAASKADASAVADLSARVTSCEGRIVALGSPITAQGQAVSALKSRVETETSARAHADMALATRIGSVQCSTNASAEQILGEIKKLIAASELSADLESRIAEIEKAGSSLSAENRSLHGRLRALELSLVTLKGQIDAARVSPSKP
ncbi:hypothetical protein [Pseudomonas fulva]|uniref:hypothetical protein n=1 Tax=Pseudomonas fulva TaxID=47880 RepID=UPI003F936EA7